MFGDDTGQFTMCECEAVAMSHAHKPYCYGLFKNRKVNDRWYVKRRTDIKVKCAYLLYNFVYISFQIQLQFYNTELYGSIGGYDKAVESPNGLAIVGIFVLVS